MLRDGVPKRSRTGQFAKTNKTYKKYLMGDFKHKCAYCGDLDSIGCGSRFYHVEHFAPKEKFPELEFVYDNLLYACPYCNGSKSDKWVSVDPKINIIGNEGFVDPCTESYDLHLDRDSAGRIFAKTEIGKYMIKELSLFLKRHELIYTLEVLRNRAERLRDCIKEDKKKGEDTSIKEKTLSELNEVFCNYYNLFLQNQDN